MSILKQTKKYIYKNQNELMVPLVSLFDLTNHLSSSSCPPELPENHSHVNLFGLFSEENAWFCPEV